MNKEVTDKFIELCHRAYEADTDRRFELLTAEASGYSSAIQTAFGVSVWGDMVREADLSFDENVLVCAGIPIYRKDSQLIENQ